MKYFSFSYLSSLLSSALAFSTVAPNHNTISQLSVGESIDNFDKIELSSSMSTIPHARNVCTNNSHFLRAMDSSFDFKNGTWQIDCCGGRAQIPWITADNLDLSFVNM